MPPNPYQPPGTEKELPEGMTYIPIVDPASAFSIRRKNRQTAGNVTAILSCVKDDPMRFSIRELFWLILVVAMGLGWWLDRTNVNDNRITAETKAKLIAGQAARLRSTLTATKPLFERYSLYAATVYTGSPPPKFPDFSPLNEPIIEP